MKKRFLAIVALIMTVLISASSLVGCNLITNDTKRDMKQVVATVNIGNEGQATEEILKSEMVMAYLNYGYYYVYEYNYTIGQTLEMIVNNLVNTKIINQYVMKYYEDENKIANPDKEKWDVERYLSDADILEATYVAIKNINDTIKTYEEAEDEKKSDKNATEVRAIPTDAKNEEMEPDKQAYVDEGIVIGELGSDRRKAYNEFLKVVENNGLLGDGFTGDFTTSEYYKGVLKEQEEVVLTENYTDSLEAESRASVTFEILEQKFREMYDSQVANFTDNQTAFSSAMDSATTANPIVYSPVNGFGYVHNLLLGASAEQTAAINAIDTEDETEHAKQRRAILNSTIAKDLRSTWITAGYDFDTATGCFTGDYAIAETPIPFQGDVHVFSEKTEEEAGQYRIDKVNEIGLNEFIQYVNKYVYESDALDVIGDIVNDASDPSVYYRTNGTATVPKDYQDRINELMFAFSTDPGCLNTYMGYKITPVPADGKETYMQEFADSARRVLAAGEGAYEVVATDYGYHFIFYSKLMDGVDYSELTDYLNSITGETFDRTEWAQVYQDMLDDWDDADESSFLYKFASALSGVTTTADQKTTAIIRSYRFDKSKVVFYKDRYADLTQI